MNNKNPTDVAMPVSISPLEKDDEPLLADVDVVAAPAADGAAEAAEIEEASASASTSLTTPFASAPPPIDSVPLNSEAPPRSALPSDTATATRRAASTLHSLPPPPASLARAASAAAAAAAASSAAAVASSSSAAASTLSSASGVYSFEHTHLATYLVLCFAVACVMHDSTQVRVNGATGANCRKKKEGGIGGENPRPKTDLACHACDNGSCLSPVGFQDNHNFNFTVLLFLFLSLSLSLSLVNKKKTGDPPKVRAEQEVVLALR